MLKIKYILLVLAFFCGIQSTIYAQEKDSTAILQQFNDAIASKAPEDTLTLLVMNYARATKKKNNDSLLEQIKNIYPKGNTAFLLDAQALYKKANEHNLNISEYKKLKLDYPDKPYNTPGTLAGNYYSAVGSIAFADFYKEDSLQAMQLIPEMSASGLNTIAWQFAEENKHLNAAEKMSKMSLDKTLKSIADSSALPEVDRAKIVKNLNMSYGSYADTYAFILAKLGRKKEALEYQVQASKWVNDQEINERYIALLNENGNYQEALDKGSEFYRQDQGSATMLEQIELAYKKLNPGKTPEAYITKLQADQKATAQANLQSSLLNTPSHDFTLLDLEGKSVSLNDYKGKIVILDFWATWCGPCIMSFPGMQLAVDRYKDNPDVAFLFIDTWERDNPAQTKKAVTQFISSKNYSFHVLLDKMDSGDEKFQVVTDYEVQGIPNKFFIGKDGKIKFVSVGFPGSTEKVLEEMSTKIDFLLKES